MCNICPQSSRLNRGSWKAFESQTHIYAKLYGNVAIACGPIYDSDTSLQKIGKNGVWVPHGFYKIVAYVDKNANLCIICKVFNQDGEVFDSTVSEIQDLISVHFSISFE